jgi:hypothetical protein
MNRVSIAVVISPCCSGTIILSATDLGPISVCDVCREEIKDWSGCQTGWILYEKALDAVFGIIDTNDIDNASMVLSKEEDNTTICGVLKMAHQRIGKNDLEAKELIRRAYVFGRRMSRAIGEYRDSQYTRENKLNREEVDKQTNKFYKSWNQDGKESSMGEKTTIPASPMLKLIVENAVLKQQMLIRQLDELKEKTMTAIDDEAKSLGLPIAGFNMDSFEFILKEEVNG